MKQMKTWSDFSDNYSLVLFNNCVTLENGAVLEEYQENHTCEAQEAQQHTEDCEKENCKTCEEYKNYYGEEIYCNCEVFQWYAIAVGEFDQEWLNKTYGMDIFFSETLQLYILPVYHFGTAWDYVSLNKVKTEDNE